MTQLAQHNPELLTAWWRALMVCLDRFDIEAHTETAGWVTFWADRREWGEA